MVTDGLSLRIMNMNPCFGGIKGIKREFSNSRTPQQNGVAKRKNMTLIEATRTMLADSLLPIPFWGEAVNTACYVQNKFDGKADEGFLVGYSINIKAFRVFNSRTRKVEENLHVNFLENKPNVAGSGPEWLFDIGYLNKFYDNPTRQAGKENVPDQEYILLPLLHTSSNVPSNSKKDESSPKEYA
ncbi:putative ribonuclease H-like domain-containing protein [Tanacetum coccineum]